jgi:hypothetical protein
MDMDMNKEMDMNMEMYTDLITGTGKGANICVRCSSSSQNLWLILGSINGEFGSCKAGFKPPSFGGGLEKTSIVARQH